MKNIKKTSFYIQAMAVLRSVIGERKIVSFTPIYLAQLSVPWDNEKVIYVGITTGHWLKEIDHMSYDYVAYGDSNTRSRVGTFVVTRGWRYWSDKYLPMFIGFKAVMA